MGYSSGMARAPVVLVADRSRLAVNLYTLLFAPLGARLLMRGSFDAALDHLRRGGTADLIVVNLNSLGPGGEDALDRLASVSRDAEPAKIFLFRDSGADDGLRRRASAVRGSIQMTRPFHPEEMLDVARKCLKGGAR